MSEHDDQCALFQWAQAQSGAYPELSLLFAIPNGAKLPWKKDSRGKRYSPEAQRLKAEGLKSGVPDTFLAVPKGPYHGLFIELKHGDNQPSPEQNRWIAALRSMGYRAEVVFGWETASLLILKYLRGELKP